MSTTDDAPSSPASSATSAPDSTAVPDIAPAAAAGPPSFANFDEAVILLCQVWNAAERDIKIAEQIDGAVIVPSINELRYAGRRFVEAQEVRVRGGDPAKADRYLGDAWFACLRARHDAIDASVSKIAKDLDAAVDSFGHVPIARGFPRFTELKRTLFDFHGASSRHEKTAAGARPSTTTCRRTGSSLWSTCSASSRSQNPRSPTWPRRPGRSARPTKPMKRQRSAGTS
ncbi:MAG: hypothetical protein GVY27_13435 [Deinococcus-Thermus bacterium]|jgi:hypothetical protein|nr:hypothetical protein [Deinococcota bacterium]